VAALVALGAAGVGAATPDAAPGAGVDPPTVELTLGPGQAATVAKRVTTPAVAPKPDIVILGDTTGSMDPVVANVRNNIDTIMDRVRAAQPDARFGVTAYKDQVDGDKVFTVFTPLTDDAGAVRAGMDNMSHDVFGGGAPWTDFLNAHFRIATDAMNFRPNGSRVILWFGDAASHDPSLGHTLADTTNALRAAGIRVVAVPVVGTSGDGLDRLGQASSIVNATGGRLMPNANADQVADALLAGIENLDWTVTPRITSCDTALEVGFDPAQRTVRSGTEAEFAETLRVRPDAAAGTYHCAVDFLVNGISQGFVQNSTVHVPGLSVGDVTVTEGDSGTALATFPVTLDRPAAAPVHVHWATGDGTATAPADYTASAGDLDFPAGSTTQTASVPIVGDLAAEPDETFTVTLSAATGAAVAGGTAVGTIRDNDGEVSPRASVGDVTVTEGNTGTTQATFTVSLDRPGTAPVSVRAATADGTATAPGDYTSVSAPVTFAPGETSKPFTVPVVGDTVIEPDETFTVTLSDPSGVEILDGQGVGTIVNDDRERPRLSIGDSSVTEGNSGTTQASFTITMDRTATAPVSVHWATADGTAAAPGDYTATSGDATIPAGQTSVPVSVLVTGDTVVEPDETFTVTLSNPAGADVVDGQGVGTIVNDDPVGPARLSIGDAQLAEGNSGTTSATFTIGLNQPAPNDVRVHWATADGTATAPGDYTATSGDATIPAGQTSVPVSVPVVGDTVVEPDETFTVVLSNPVGAEILDGQGVGTIVNDDRERPRLSIGDSSVAEGNSGTTQASFTITMDRTATAPVSVHWATADGTATSPGDYTARAGDAAIPAGQTSVVVTVPVVGDLLFEPDETFTVALSNPVDADILDGQGVGTIVNDDSDTPPDLRIDDLTISEGDAGSTAATFTISLNHPSPNEVRVHWATGDGTATAPGDYLAAAGDETFAPGDTSRRVSVPVVGDTVVEPDETFTVILANPSGANIVDGQGVGTIRNDDSDQPRPRLSVGDVAVGEGNTGTTPATFTITLDRAATTPVTVHRQTVDGTAVAPGDYTARSGDETFAAGEVTRQVTVDVNGDTGFEADETFAVELSNASGADILDGQGAGTIINDDTDNPRPQLSIGDASVAEGDSGATPATFTVTLANGTAPGNVTVEFTTADGTAAAPGDFAATAGHLTFTPGQTSQTVTVPVTGDTAVEPDETFTVALSNPSGADILDGQGAGTIINDDTDNPRPQLSIGDASVAEGDSGATPATFTITLSQAPASGSVSVHWATADDTATAPGDYTAGSGDVTFAAGQLTRQVTVPVAGDTAVEGDETFTVRLSNPVNAELLDAQGVGAIVNDDGVVGTPALRVGDVTVTEGDTGTTRATFTVSLDHAATSTVTGHVATADGTATAPADYRALAADLQFPPGVTSRPVTVDIAGDLTGEPAETFTVNLSNPVNATIADGQGTGTIVDDDPVRGGVFTCTATAFNLSGPVANPANLPCRDDARSLAAGGVNLGLLSIRVSTLTAATGQQPDDLTAPPADGDDATGRAGLSSARISALGLVSIEVGMISSTAEARCVAGPGGLVPRLTGSSSVAALKVNGVTIPVGSGPLRIPLLIGTLELNTTVTTASSVTQRAFALTSLFGSVIIGEARAGLSGNPCA
jgi:hypothetical protein